MEREGPFYGELSEERRGEIGQRAKVDALSFLESRFKKNLFGDDLPKHSRRNVLRMELLEACSPVWEKAYGDLAIKTEEEKRLYQETFLVEGGYMR